MLDRESNSFQARVHLELLKDMLNVIPYRTRADRKESSDILGTVTVCQEGEDFPFAWGQHLQLRLRLCPVPVWNVLITPDHICQMA